MWLLLRHGEKIRQRLVGYCGTRERPRLFSGHGKKDGRILIGYRKTRKRLRLLLCYGRGRVGQT